MIPTNGSERPSVDVVVPFGGSAQELAAVLRRMAELRLHVGDTLLVVDNTPRRRALPAPDGPARVLRAAARPTPAFARNRGAAEGSGEWLLFLDADTAPPPDLIDRYFDPPPQVRTGLIAGGVIDEQVSARAPLAARYAQLRGAMSQQDTFDFGAWGYPKSANIACRRSAFDAVGGFREQIRAAEDADLTYRLRAAGWALERREHAAVVHFSRTSVRALLKQKALWGAGGAWIEREYPGAVTLVRGSSAVRWAAGSTARVLLGALRRRDRDAAIYALLRPLEALAWELGRLLSNERGERSRRTR